MRNGVCLAAVAVLLAACGGGSGAEEKEALPKGQAVATVNDKEITVHELNAELSGLDVPAGEQRKQFENQALQGLVDRTILADIARERGLDKSPSYLLQRRRANEALLVQMLQGDIASKVPPPTRAEADRFMQENPYLFANRQIYQIDQIQFAPPQDPAKLRELQPLRTLEEIERKLIEDRIEYRRGNASLDPLNADPAVARQIAALPAGEVFIIPVRGAMTANRITGSQPQPFTGEQAANFAMSLVQRRKVGEAADRELKARVEAARKTVRYQPGFSAPKQAAPANGAAPAPTPAAATKS